MHRSLVQGENNNGILSRGSRAVYAKEEKGESTQACWGTLAFKTSVLISQTYHKYFLAKTKEPLSHHSTSPNLSASLTNPWLSVTAQTQALPKSKTQANCSTCHSHKRAPSGQKSLNGYGFWQAWEMQVKALQSKQQQWNILYPNPGIKAPKIHRKLGTRTSTVSLFF